MKLITFTCLFVVLSVGTGLADGPRSWGEYFNDETRNHLTSANARYVRHHRHRGHHRDPVYNPDRGRISPDTAVVKASWPYVQEKVIFPYATGTSILDDYSGRRPVISGASCANPTIRWYQLEQDLAFSLFK